MPPVKRNILFVMPMKVTRVVLSTVLLWRVTPIPFWKDCLSALMLWGLTEGYIYIRSEYKLAHETLEIALKQANEKGLVGNNILGSGFSFSVKMRGCRGFYLRRGNRSD